MLEEHSVDDLEHRLQEKEQMVATLTEYLEQAAEKINGLQKQPASSPAARAFDPGMVRKQMDLVEQLQTAVKEWEQLQAPNTLERISGQLDKLRDTLLDGFQSAKPSPSASQPPVSPITTSIMRATTPQSQSPKQEGSALEGWEALKAEMLKDDSAPVEAEVEEQNICLKEELSVLVNRPARVEVECQDSERWQEAVDSREKYTIALIRALRVVESRRRGNPDWDAFAAGSVQLRDEVAQSAMELQQSLRNAEVELSIERARISRQESLIAQQRREIEKATKKQGYQAQQSEACDATDSQGRWLKFLGRANPDG